MRSPGAAIAWEFRRKHRWGLLALCAYVVTLAAIKLAVVARGLPVQLDTPESFAFVVVVPLTATFTYFLAVFSFGLGGDLAARQSMYPARLFTLPLTTDTLVAWPMLIGTAAMGVLWIATRMFALWPTGIDAPLIWPALLAAALLAWTQALTWMPYGLPGMRVVVTVLWLAIIDTIALLALHFKASEAMMLAIAVPQLPLAYLVARVAVARARRGEVPDWREAFGAVTALGTILPGPKRHFSSPARAQAWLEWRRRGRSLPALVSMLLPFELALLWLAVDAPSLVFTILLGVLFTPVFLASFTGAAILTPFIATRPMTSGALVGAKLRATTRGTLVAWVIVLLAIPIALVLSDTWRVLQEHAARLRDMAGTERTVAIAVLIVAGFIVATWKQLVQTFYVSLTGREWIIKGRVFLVLVFLVLLGPSIRWIIENKDVQVVLWNTLPLALGVLACIKMVVAIVVVTRLQRRRLLSDRALVAGAACWMICVLALCAVFMWFVDSRFFPSYVLMIIAILVIPLARVSASPLALAWDRHR